MDLQGDLLGLSSNDDDLPNKIRVTRDELLHEYSQPHGHPWIIGYSGGRDSTLVVHLVVEMLLALAPSERLREVHIVANDTLVESPLVVGHLRSTMQRFATMARAFCLPVHVQITSPDPDQTFWVNLIGRGYPSPSRSFRWCTDRMKILPTSRYIRVQAMQSGTVILLLGVRRAESAARAARVDRYSESGQRLNPHNDLPGCMVFRPIVDLATDEVWELLATLQPPWGGDHSALITLYRNASGGECPVVTQRSDAPSCGTSSSRFGCWTCTVVVKDRSLEGFVDSGFAQFTPLLRFRDWLAAIRDEPGRRSNRRRNGAITIDDQGTLVRGPFTLETRREVLDRLLAMQVETGTELLTDAEIEVIRRLWAEDAAKFAGFTTPAPAWSMGVSA